MKLECPWCGEVHRIEAVKCMGGGTITLSHYEWRCWECKVTMRGESKKDIINRFKGVA